MANIILTFTLSICLVTDLKNRKIHNAVLLPALMAAILNNLWKDGLMGLKTTGFGFILGFLILLIPFILGGMGAGDVKLLATIGAIKGPHFVIYTAIWMGLVGGAIAFILLIYKKQLLRTLKDIGSSFWIMFVSGFKVISFHFKVENNMFPYGLAITMGAIMAFIIVG